MAGHPGTEPGSLTVQLRALKVEKVSGVPINCA